MSHAGNHLQAGVRDLLSERLAVRQRAQWVFCAVDDQGWGLDRGQRGQAVVGHLSCGHVVVVSGGEVAGSVVGGFEEAAGGGLVEGQGVAVQDAPGL